MVGKGCNEAKLNVLSEVFNPHLSFISGQKGSDIKKERKVVNSLNLWMWIGSLPTPSPPSLLALI